MYKRQKLSHVGVSAEVARLSISARPSVNRQSIAGLICSGLTSLNLGRPEKISNGFDTEFLNFLMDKYLIDES